MNENPYMMLAKVILPSEMTEYFDLVKVVRFCISELLVKKFLLQGEDFTTTVRKSFYITMKKFVLRLGT